MPEAERARDIKKVNIIFAVSSIFLLVITVWMILDDYTREWKSIQREFYKRDYKKTQAEMQQARTQIDKRQMDSLIKERQAAQAQLNQHKKTLEDLQKKLRDNDAKLYKASQIYQFAKSEYSAVKYEYETLAADKDPAAERARKNLEQARAAMEARARDVSALTEEQTGLQNQINQFVGKIDDVNKQIAKLLDKEELLQKKLEKNRPSFVNMWLRNAPILDMMNPSIRIQQVVIDNVYNDVNFMHIPRVDRCITCHVAVDKKGYDGTGFPPPYHSHPNLELFVDSKSKHPVERFGCTVCHQGRDRGTSFVNAVHTPHDEKQHKRWMNRYDWEEFEHWDTPMLPLPYTQSQCFKCHQNQVSLQQADELNKGRLLFERSGCFGCHKVSGFENLRKIGPTLTHVASKLNPEWTVKWVKDPKSFYPTTRMPKFFDLTNTSGPHDRVRNDVEANAIVAYLFKSSDKIDYEQPGIKGDPKRGEELVQSIGCFGCHYVGAPANAPIDDRRMFGPDLKKVGSKTHAAWLYNWVKNPKHYFPNTFMPNLRLSDQEAADITAFLIMQRDPGFEQTPPLQVDAGVRDQMVLDYLKLSERDPKTKLSAMSEQDRNAFLGEKLIGRYGCFACHEIKGFEKAQPIGVELTQEGSKNIHQLDFGFLKIPHSRHDWFYQKIKDPRIFDMMPDMKSTKVKTPEEKLKMPNFQFRDDEIKSLVTFLLGLTKDKIGPELKRNLSPKEVAIEEGRRIVKQFNCQGCHILENTGGNIRNVIPDPGFYPPMLEGEGEMVKTDWLFNFIKAPSKIRPWLKVRMPTFNLTDADINSLTRYFAYSSNQDFPYKHYEYEFPREHITTGKLLTDDKHFQCFRCHIAGVAPPGREAADLAPDLSLAKTRLKPDWIARWIDDPQKFRPGTRMPTFFPDKQSPYANVLGGNADNQIQALRDYVLSLGDKSLTGLAENRRERK